MLLEKIRRPILFQGRKKNKEYFEGWYYKQDSKDGKSAVCFIPGVSLDPDDAHSFVQYIEICLDESNNRITKTTYFRYELQDFSSSDNPFMVRIAENIFTESMLSVKLADHDITVEGSLTFGPFTPIKTSVLTPNIMGFFAYLPKMECYHGVISMNHTLHGSLNVNKQDVDFNSGKGYIEKDWGTSFPKRYIWVQCNHFEDRNVSIFCSVADIPFMKSSFLGHICNLVIDGTEYRFATYHRSMLKIECVTDQRISLMLENREAKLRIEASLTSMGQLVAPRMGRMQEAIKEGLSGEIKITLFDRHNGIVYEGCSNMAGIEIRL